MLTRTKLKMAANNMFVINSYCMKKKKHTHTQSLQNNTEVSERYSWCLVQKKRDILLTHTEVLSTSVWALKAKTYAMQ